VTTRTGRASQGVRATRAVVVTLMLLSAPLHAQTRGAYVSARAGIAVADDNYRSNCGHASLAFSVDVQGRRRLFPQVSFDHFAGAGGGDILCLPVSPSIGTGVGGLRLEGATRVGLGVGGRLGSGAVQLEGAVLSGVISGRRGFVGRDQDDSRRVSPHVGGQASLVLFRFVVLSAAANWTRLSLDVIPTSGGTAMTRTSWSPMTTWQIGVRVRAGR